MGSGDVYKRQEKGMRPAENGMPPLGRPPRMPGERGDRARRQSEKLRELDNPVARVSAVHTGANARRASADMAEGLERDLYLAKGAKVMLTKNLYQQVGLVISIRSEVVELVYADDAPPPKLPLWGIVVVVI